MKRLNNKEDENNRCNDNNQETGQDARKIQEMVTITQK